MQGGANMRAVINTTVTKKIIASEDLHLLRPS